MSVHVDATLPVHPLTVDDLEAMVSAGILDEDDKVELLDGVLVEMSPQSPAHLEAVNRLTMLSQRRRVPDRVPPLLGARRTTSLPRIGSVR